MKIGLLASCNAFFTKMCAALGVGIKIASVKGTQ